VKGTRQLLVSETLAEGLWVNTGIVASPLLGKCPTAVSASGLGQVSWVKTDDHVHWERFPRTCVAR